MIRRLIFPSAGVVLLAGGLVAGVFLGPSLPAPLGGSKPGVAAEQEATTGPKPSAADQRGTSTKPASQKYKEVRGLMYPLKERIVNLADSGIFRYLKVQVVLEIYDEAYIKAEASASGGGAGHSSGSGKKEDVQLPPHIAPRLAKIEDIVNATLSAKTTSELATAEGKNKLKEELVAKINDAFREEIVLAVYFTQFVMQ